MSTNNYQLISKDNYVSLFYSSTFYFYQQYTDHADAILALEHFKQAEVDIIGWRDSFAWASRHFCSLIGVEQADHSSHTHPLKLNGNSDNDK
jgi:hypothetical protein